MHWQFILITPQTSVTIICGIQPAGVVTMVMKVLHNTCNMCTCNLPVMNALIPWTSGVHIRQIPMPMLQPAIAY